MKKAVLYARVSSDEQEKQGFSIPAQVKFLKDYAKKNNITIVREFTESETAKQSGRKEFNAMVKFLKSSKDVNIILVEKTDRLYRNFKDYGELGEEDFEIHLVKENEIIGKNATSHQKFIHGIKVLMAKNYIDNLREETMKGLREKAEEGIFPNRAPFGYKNVRNKQGKNDIAIDDEKAPFIKRAFEIYSSGDISVKNTAQQLFNEGYCYRPYAAKIPTSALEVILKNPFYTGVFKFRGEIMQGKHTPIISDKLFLKVQQAFKKDGKPLYRKHQFLLGNFFTCGDCGRSVVAEIKKDKYVYYHCTWSKGKDKCKNRKYHSESVLLKQLDEAVEAIQIDKSLKRKILESIIELNNSEQTHQKAQIQRLNASAEKMRNEIRMIYQDKLDGAISKEQWQEENEIRQQRLTAIKIQIEALDNTNQKFMDEINSILELLENLYHKYLQLSDENKVKILKTLLSNCILDDGKLSWTYKKPFCYIAKTANFDKILPEMDSNHR